MPLRFSKVHGLGNDFVLLDLRAGGQLPTPAVAQRLCDRRAGIGADGVLTLLPPGGPGAGARLHIYNADGSEPEMCGNGLRCAAQLLLRERRSASVVIETPAGPRRCEPGAEGTIRAEMGSASIGAALELSVLGETVRGLVVSMGNPHFVIFDERANEVAARRLGPELERHPRFAPGRTNVELYDVGPEGLRVFVWERGSGFTQACGTGACATAVAAIQEGRVAPAAELTVDLPGGRLFVTVAKDSAVALRGPAEWVYSGELTW